MPVTITPQMLQQVSDPALAQSGFSSAESAVTFVSPGPTSPAAVVAEWTDARDNFAIAYLPSGAVTFSRCSRRTCGLGGGAVATAMDQATTLDVPCPTGSCPLGEACVSGMCVLPNFSGDPAVAGATNPSGSASGIVVALNLGLSISGMHPSGSDAVVAVASFGGGRPSTWGRTQAETVIVNEGTGDCDVGGAPSLALPASPITDRPRISFDPFLSTASSATFWIAWTGPNDSLCVRSVTASAGVLTRGPSVPPMPGVTMHNGSFVIRSHLDFVYVMWSELLPGGCDRFAVTWHIRRSHDGGATWDTPHVVWSAPRYRGCFGVIPDPNFTSPCTNDASCPQVPVRDSCFAQICGRPLTDGWSSFDFDIDQPSGTFWAVVHDSANQARVLRSVVEDGATWSTDYVVPSSLPVGQLALIVAPSGNVGVSMYRQVAGSPPQVQRWIAARDELTNTWSLPVPISPVFAPTATAAGGSVAGIGEYQGLAAIDPFQFGGSSFFPVWTEIDPTDTNLYRIEGRGVAVTP